MLWGEKISRAHKIDIWCFIYMRLIYVMYICFCAANPYPDVRRRYWNAYMLFYQKISDQNSPVLPKKSRVSIMRQEAEDLTLWVHPSPSRSAMDNVHRHQLFIFTRSISKARITEHPINNNLYWLYSPGLLHPPLMFHHSPLPAPPGPTMTASPCLPAWCARERRRACLWRKCLPASIR